MSAAAYWNIAGLLATLFGVLLLFWFAMPYRISQLNEGSTFADQPTPRDTMLNRRYRFLAGVGLVLVVFGTAAQIWAAVLAQPA